MAKKKKKKIFENCHIRCYDRTFWTCIFSALDLTFSRDNKKIKCCPGRERITRQYTEDFQSIENSQHDIMMAICLYIDTYVVPNLDFDWL